MRVGSGFITTSSWLALALALSLAIALQLTGRYSLAETPPGQLLQSKATLPAIPELKTSLQLSSNSVEAIIARPLFSHSRRPPVIDRPGVRPSPAPTTPSTFLSLVGTLSRGSSEIALLHHHQQGAIKVGLGEIIDGWSVASISRDRVLLRRGEVTAWLTSDLND